MKKIILIILIFMLVNCNSNEDDNSAFQLLSPPDWALGNWKQTDIGNQGYTTEYIFTNNNVQYIIDGGNAENFNQYGKPQEGLTGHTFTQTELIISENVYEVRRTHRYNSTIMNDWIWKWVKETEKTMRFELSVPEAPNVLPQISHYIKQ